MKKAISMLLATAMVVSMTACGGSSSSTTQSAQSDVEVPTIDQIALGEDYLDLTADITILTNRTDIADTVYKDYATQFMELYPNISVTYEAITDYEESLALRLTNGDWGDICFIPTSCEMSEFSTYFIKLGDYSVLSEIYNFVHEKTYEGVTYGIPNGGTAGGIAYNKAVWAEAGITELPKTPDEFIEALRLIKENTDAIPLYTNFAAGWTMGAWNDYVGIASNGDPDYRNEILLHTRNPFTKNEENSGPYAVYYTLYTAVAEGLVEEDPASSDWESSKVMINNGEIGAMVLGSWCVQQFKEAGDHPEDIGYMPFPISVNGVQSAAAGGNYAYAVNNKTSAENQIASMIYVKWLLEESTIMADEGSIPALIGQDLPESLAEFEGVTLSSNSQAKEGEENLYDDIRNTAEVLSGDYPVATVLEAALYGNITLDELMDEWNEKWSNAQDSCGAEIYE